MHHVVLSYKNRTSASRKEDPRPRQVRQDRTDSPVQEGMSAVRTASPRVTIPPRRSGLTPWVP